MRATRATTYRIIGLGEEDIKRAFHERSGYTLDELELEWNGDYADGVPFSYLSGEGRTLLQAYATPDGVPDEVAKWFEDVTTNAQGTVIGVVTLAALTDDYLDQWLLDKLALRTHPQLASHGTRWNELPMQDFEGVYQASVDEEEVTV